MLCYLVICDTYNKEICISHNQNKFMYLYTLILIFFYYFLNLLFRLRLKENHSNNNKYNIRIFLYIEEMFKQNKKIYIVEKFFKKKSNSYIDLCKIIHRYVYYNDV